MLFVGQVLYGDEAAWHVGGMGSVVGGGLGHVAVDGCGLVLGLAAGAWLLWVWGSRMAPSWWAWASCAIF